MEPKLRGTLARALVAIASLGVVSCGAWVPPAPTAPSHIQENPTSGATISGLVNDGSGVSPLTAASASSMTVTVVGTQIRAEVSVSGRFILREVPSGTIFLRFTGPGVDATVRVDGVADRDVVDLRLTVQAGTARIESRVRIAIDSSTEIDGPVTQVSGTCPNLTIRVNDWTVNLDASSAGACADVRVGVRIKIRGRRSGDVIVVIRVDVDVSHRDDDDDDDHHDNDDDHDDDEDDDDD